MARRIAKLSMVGDGSYLMLNNEIATSVMLDKKLVIVLLDNRGTVIAFSNIVEATLQQHAGRLPQYGDRRRILISRMRPFSALSEGGQYPELEAALQGASSQAHLPYLHRHRRHADNQRRWLVVGGRRPGGVSQ
jgi:hypothetical protein